MITGNGYVKKNISIVCIAIISSILLWAGICTGTTIYWRHKYNRLVEQHRLELELARTETEECRRTLQELRRTSSELGECIQQSICSVQDLRGLIGEVRKRYEEMEVILNNTGDDHHIISDNNDGSATGQ